MKNETKAMIYSKLYALTIKINYNLPEFNFIVFMDTDETYEIRVIRVINERPTGMVSYKYNPMKEPDNWISNALHDFLFKGDFEFNTFYKELKTDILSKLEPSFNYAFYQIHNEFTPYPAFTRRRVEPSHRGETLKCMHIDELEYLEDNIFHSDTNKESKEPSKRVETNADKNEKDTMLMMRIEALEKEVRLLKNSMLLLRKDVSANYRYTDKPDGKQKDTPASEVKDNYGDIKKQLNDEWIKSRFNNLN